MRDLSIDIETLASGTNAALTQIGACYRDADGELVTFFADVLDDTGVYSATTLQWHRTQGGVALPGPDARRWTAALPHDFNAWLREAGAHVEGAAALWTHATFDIPRLGDAYERLGMRAPWHYRNCRDLRTLYDLAGGRPTLPRVGEHHNALDDAIYQLGEIEACRKHLSERLLWP